MQFKSITTLLLTLIFQWGCSLDDGRPLKIATNLWPGYEPLYLAQYIGAYDQRVDVIQLASATEVMRALRHSNIDGAALTMDEALTVMSQRTELVVLLALDFSQGADAIVGFPQEGGELGLKGKRVGVENTALGAMVLSEALIQNGLTVTDIEITNVSFDMHERAIANGDVDLVVTFEPAKSRLMEKGARVLFDTTMAPQLVVDVLVVKRSVFNNQRKDVTRLLNGYFAARSYMISNRSESMTFFSKRLGLSMEQTKKAFAGVHLPTLQENIDWFSGEPSSYEKSIRSIVSVLQGRDILSSDFKLVVYGDAHWLQEVTD